MLAVLFNNVSLDHCTYVFACIICSICMYFYCVICMSSFNLNLSKPIPTSVYLRRKDDKNKCDAVIY